MNPLYSLCRSLRSNPLRAALSRRSFSALVDTFDAFVTCQPGLEPVLSQELQSLGIQHRQSKSPSLPGIEISRASIDDLYSCHLQLGTASRILLRCCPDFSARALGELQRKLAPGSTSSSSWVWLDAVADNAKIQVKAVARKSRLYHTGAIEERVMESIQRSVGSRISVVDHRTQSPKPPSTGRHNPTQGNNESTLNFHVSVIRDVVSIWMDTSCSPLHQRGYRLQTAKAPLREDLSFALLYSAGWRPAASGHRSLSLTSKEPRPESRLPTRHLLDPFCGSGTIVIEAAAMASGLPPGRLRPPPFAGTNMHDPTRWQNLVRQCEARVQNQDQRDGRLVHGSDRDEGGVAIATANARRAGVLDGIDLRHCAFSAHPCLEDPEAAPKSLLIATNPPFGRRISAASSTSSGPRKRRREDTSPLLPLYQRLSDRVKSLMRRPECSTNDVSMILLADDHALVQHAFAGWRHDVVLRTSHGGIPVQFISVCMP
jgi:putative N6-adenine-specific DNA methylase